MHRDISEAIDQLAVKQTQKTRAPQRQILISSDVMLCTDTNPRGRAKHMSSSVFSQRLFFLDNITTIFELLVECVCYKSFNVFETKTLEITVTA